MFEYKNIVKKLTPKEDKFKNNVISFLSGGIIGMISEIIVNATDVNTMLLVWIVIASILTGIGIGDELVFKFKMGVIIPITGFSHSVTAASLDYKKEGFVTGIGTNYFKLGGSVILYGIVSSAIFTILRGVL